MTSASNSSAGRRPDLSEAFPDGQLQVIALGDRAFRVRFQPSGGDDHVPPSNILFDSPPPAGLSTFRGDGVVGLALPFIKCELDTASGRLRFFDSEGRLLLAEAVAGRDLSESRLGDEIVYIAEQRFESPADERIYGTGCFQDGALDIRRLPRRLTQVNSQISLPFILSSRGYGLLWHNRGMAEFNMPANRLALAEVSKGGSQVDNVTTISGNAEVTRRLATFEGTLTVETGGRHAFLLDIGRKMGSRYRVDIDGVTCVDFTNLWLPPTMSFFADLAPGEHRVTVEANDTDAPSLFFGPAADQTVWRAPVADAIDYIVIAGPAAGDVMGTYRDLLGATPVLPRYAYGYVHCRERFHSTDEIIETLDEFRRRRLPVDVMVQDWQYWGKHGWNAMRFDEDHYPDPAFLVRELHNRQARLMLSVWSRVGRDTELGKEIARRGFYIPDTEWVDFFNPEAVAFYCASQEEGLGQYGVDAWWQDATEPENDDLDGRMTAAGRGERIRLIYPLQVTRAVWESRRAIVPDERAMILTRCAFLGQQRYGAVTWSGDVGHDWETLKRQIPAGLNMAAAGYPYWTVDAGGFFRPGDGQYTDPAYQERFLRWFQYATFLPMLRVHGYQTNTEFWRYGEDVETVSRQYLELRYRLLPYIYAMAAETSRTGVPLMRPLVFDFAHDPRALDQAHSYMFGRALHVAPVFEPGVDEWSVYLPESEGGWFDLWTGERRAGGQEHLVPTPLDRIPLHGRAGSILPVGPVLQSTADAGNDTIDLYVFPGRDATLDLYEDQGLDNGYETGSSSIIPLTWDDKAGQLTVGERRGSFPGMHGERRFVVHRVGPGVSPMTADSGQAVSYSGAAVHVQVR
ncbi:glycoside hydrolase family 31 protein [Mesorhizobium sp. BR1-1-16]|uniref:glycoside hydrolase family 31 protein n=1 Tax=Mesorhizobium sp. BR1-1-16 TaxID=2876653 RepID=UPI001CCFE101|nr:TIM-barrel domain-containing protein [Mesorhizobium sp. BR1-1-16]MBZ9937250.1 glycoside hydrolase family 31 protein [Mesorhizobium sp. BR1-1-16]